MVQKILLDELEIPVKKLTFVIKGEWKVLYFLCDNYKIEDNLLLIYINENLVGLDPIEYIDKESILYE